MAILVGIFRAILGAFGAGNDAGSGGDGTLPAKRRVTQDGATRVTQTEDERLTQ